MNSSDMNTGWITHDIVCLWRISDDLLLVTDSYIFEEEE